MKIAIIGGGAAGFFSALSIKQHFPNHEVIILEKTTKVLARLKFLVVADATLLLINGIQLNFPSIIQEVKTI